MHGRILYALAMVLVVFSLFVLWAWTGPLGAAIAAFTTHIVLSFCERQRDGERALERKRTAAALRGAVRRDAPGRRGRARLNPRR